MCYHAVTVSDPTYSDAHVHLRRPERSDARAVFDLSHDSETMRFYGMPPFVDLHAAEAQLEWYLRLFESNSGRWAIADRGSNELVGDIGLFNAQPDPGRVEIGFKLASAYWRRGIMRGCLSAVLEHGFTRLGYDRIEALVDTRNLACTALLQGVGFRWEGLLSDYELDDGRDIDMEMYSKLRRNFHGQRRQ